MKYVKSIAEFLIILFLVYLGSMGFYLMYTHDGNHYKLILGMLMSLLITVPAAHSYYKLIEKLND